MSKFVGIRPHARKQLEERGISEDLVRETLFNPGQVVLSRIGRKIAQRIIKHKEEDFEDKEILEVKDAD